MVLQNNKTNLLPEKSIKSKYSVIPL